MKKFNFNKIIYLIQKLSFSFLCFLFLSFSSSCKNYNVKDRLGAFRPYVDKNSLQDSSLEHPPFYTPSTKTKK